MQQRLLLLFLLVSTLTIHAQSTVSTWNLETCINYALQHNIQVQQANISVESANIDLLSAKAARLPSLNGEVSQTFSNSKIATLANQYINQSQLSGRYSLSAGIVLFNGNQTSKNVQQQSLQVASDKLTVQQTKNDIVVAITQAYLQILYDNETVKTDRQTVTASEAQLTQSKELLDAGSIAENDFAQVETQYTTDKYTLTVAENALQQDILTLKQLLELGINDSFQPYFPTLSDDEILKPMPDLQTVYQNTIATRPEMKNSQLNVQIATVAYQKSKGAYWPTLSLSASIGTGNQYNNNETFSTQLNNNFSQSVGLTLSIPLLDNRQVRSAVEQAKLNIQNAQLNLTATQKDLLKTVETLYQNLLSAQSKYVAAVQQEKAAQISYSLVEEQFNLGMKNTVDLLTAKNTFLAAQQQVLQAKYASVLNMKLLNFYQNIPITL